MSSSFKVSSFEDIPIETPIEDIPIKVERVRNGFKSHKTQNLEFRKGQLRNIYYAILDNLDLLYASIQLDLNKSQLETDLTEIAFIFKEITYFIENLDKLAKPESIGVEVIMKPATGHIYKNPYGTVLVISPWNYPIVLAVSPVIAAIAAGNSVVLKCSELCPNTSRLVIKILNTALDSEIFTGVTGAIPQSTVLLKEKFDKILYTGNSTVGRIVSRAAAEHLTPVLLELGGKSPVIITKNADLKLAARRVLWGKQVNAGQTCVAPDYILVDAAIKPKFIAELKKVYEEYFPDNDKETWTSYSRIINERHFDRVTGILKKSEGTVIVGGISDPHSKLITPTFIDKIKPSDALMEDELFGPLIGIITVTSTQEAIDFICNEHDTPLAIYIFSNNFKEQEEIIAKTRSGGVGINDPLMHVALLNAPFGGVGESGTGGGYHGKFGFDAFSHSRTVFSQSSLVERLLTIRYPPYLPWKQDTYHKMIARNPWFSREGPVKKSFFKRLFGGKVLAVLFFSTVAYLYKIYQPKA
ncbi:hypothetical protein D0Z00_002745 [Geotrichum galactomycetum]|uniref:Uncharacterized protein n=1 Tax=Geotrichum galactomycetum TaxID=27317 RepID=A0ACB6V3E2_9ASCO|nr:hypothetical protein D0Z00_002745 [Geotrichum candidum]